MITFDRIDALTASLEERLERFYSKTLADSARSADKAPYGIDMFFPIFFPVFLFYWIKRKAGDDDKSN